MRIPLAVAAIVLLAPALTGCSTPASTGPVEQLPPALVVAEAQSDVGNDRPSSSFDGLMVRRRTVLAIGLNRYDAIAGLQRHLQRVAQHRGTTLTTVTSGVLDPLPLEQFAPDLVMALPAETNPAAGGRLMAAALRPARWSSIVKTHVLLSVLVHDLKFTVATPHPGELARAIAREGIASDALGNYTVVPGKRELRILYTGPLISDGLVHAVQAGIARPAQVNLAAVKIGPRTKTGVGVDLSKEPTPPPEQFSPHSGHEHGH